MASEQEFREVVARIRRDAPGWQVDLDAQQHAFTVWADDPRRMDYCGSAPSFEEAWEQAAQHVGMTRPK